MEAAGPNPWSSRNTGRLQRPGKKMGKRGHQTKGYHREPQLEKNYYYIEVIIGNLNKRSAATKAAPITNRSSIDFLPKVFE